MKQRLATLATLLARQKQDRDAAVGQLEQAQGRAQAARQQAAELGDYRQGLQARWGAQPGQRVDMTVLRAYQGFEQRLEAAIGLQQGVVQGQERQVQQARAQLVQRETRVATTERLLDRTERSLSRAAEQRDQRRADEAATQRLLRGREETPT